MNDCCEDERMDDCDDETFGRHRGSVIYPSGALLVHTKCPKIYFREDELLSAPYVVE